MAAPANRVGAGAREQRWNAALARGQDAEAHRAALAQRHVPLREEQRRPFLRLGQALRAVWHQAAAPEGLKKRLRRTVLPESRLQTTQEPPAHRLPLHWQGGVHTEGRGARHTGGQHGRATEPDSMAVIRALAKVCRDVPMAATLNRLG